MSSDVDAVYSALDSVLEDFASAVARQIRVEAPGYGDVVLDEHLRDAFVQIRAALDGLRTGAQASDLDLALARDVGRRRAMAGIPLTDVVEAYHVAYREMWFELMRLATARGAQTVGALASDAALLWNWSHRLTAAMAAAHTDQSMVLANESASLRRQLLEVLTGGQDRSGEGAATVRRLGLDPASTFTVAVVAGLTATEADELARRITGPGVLALGCHDGARAVIVAQGADEVRLSSSIERFQPHSRAGVGCTRRGLHGAQLSLQDATDAHTRAIETGARVIFADDWMLCVLGTAKARLEPLLEVGRAAARQHPEWARTVVEFGTHGLSAAAASEALGVHPNSVRYRIDQWAKVTGWNPRDLSGLVASLIAITSEMPMSATPLRVGRPSST